MKSADICDIAVLVEGLPLNMQTHETAYAIKIFVRKRLFTNHRITLTPCVGVLHGEARESVDIFVLSDHRRVPREIIAYYTEQLLQLQYIERGEPRVPCIFKL